MPNKEEHELLHEWVFISKPIGLTLQASEPG